jgi:hypothetical protein
MQVAGSGKSAHARLATWSGLALYDGETEDQLAFVETAIS